MRRRASTESLRKTALFSLPVLSGAFLFLVLGAAPTASPQTTHKQHTITVKFVYDFRPHDGCPAKAPCVKQFNVYNVTEHRQRALLFIIDVPHSARGKVFYISGQSKPLTFAPGEHMIAVTAQWDTGAESDLLACTTMIDVKD